MAQVNVEVVARTEQATRNLNNLTKNVGGMSKALRDDAAGALGVFGVSLTSLNQPLTLVADQLKESITKAANWGDAMGDLAQVTGATVEETSLMAASFELVGVSVGNIESAMKAMTKNGMTPNLETMKRLAAQYQAIQDPIQRNEFLFKNFGKSGLDLAEIMGKSTDELERLAAAARTSGKVIGGEASEAAEEFNLQMAIFQQKVEGAQIAVGNLLIPSLNTAATALDQLVKIWQMGNVKLREQRGEIDGATAALEMQRIAGIEPVTEATETNTAATQEAIVATDAWMASFVEGVPAAVDYADALNNTARVAAGLKMGLGELTTATLYNQAAAGLDGLASLELARAMGLIDEKAYSAGAELEELRKKYDTNKDGAIDATEAAAGYTREILELAKATSLIPRTIPIDIKITKFGDEDFGGWTPPKGAAGASNTIPSDSAVNGMRAAGGPVVADGAYIVGEFGRELFIPKSDGYVMSNDVLSQTHMGGVTINVNGAGNPSAVAAEVNRQLGAAGRNADTRIRTGSR